MKKIIFTTTTLLCSILAFTISTSCGQSSAKKQENKSESVEEVINDQEISSGEEWLKSIFLCDNGNGYCFPDEEKVTTKRYYEFFIESLAIREYPMFETEEEEIAAEKEYVNKWKDIYPLKEDVSYPLGRGNGSGHGDPLENVTITPLSDMKYNVFINFGGTIKAITEVTLVTHEDSYLIDYMESEYIE